MVTIVAVPRAGTAARTLLVELKVVDGPYPFYGDLELDPAGALAPLLGDDGVVVAPDLLARTAGLLQRVRNDPQHRWKE